MYGDTNAIRRCLAQALLKTGENARSGRTTDLKRKKKRPFSTSLEHYPCRNISFTVRECTAPPAQVDTYSYLSLDHALSTSLARSLYPAYPPRSTYPSCSIHLSFIYLAACTLLCLFLRVQAHVYVILDVSVVQRKRVGEVGRVLRATATAHSPQVSLSIERKQMPREEKKKKTGTKIFLLSLLSSSLRSFLPPSTSLSLPYQTRGVQTHWSTS